MPLGQSDLRLQGPKYSTEVEDATHHCFHFFINSSMLKGGLDSFSFHPQGPSRGCSRESVINESSKESGPKGSSKESGPFQPQGAGGSIGSSKESDSFQPQDG